MEKEGARKKKRGNEEEKEEEKVQKKEKSGSLIDFNVMQEEKQKDWGGEGGEGAGEGEKLGNYIF